MYRKMQRHLHNNQRYGKYHRKPVTYSGTLMWEFGIRRNRYHVDNMQMMWTDESQVMMSCGSCTSQSNKSIAQINRTNELHKMIAQNKMTSHPGMEMTNDAFGCSRATQVHMEDLRLVNLTEICPSRRGECFKAPC